MSFQQKTSIVTLLYDIGNVFLMASRDLYTLAKTNMSAVTLGVLISLIIIFGGIAVYSGTWTSRC